MRPRGAKGEWAATLKALKPETQARLRGVLDSAEFAEDTKAAFSRFDKDGNGAIDAKELPEALAYFDDLHGAQVRACSAFVGRRRGNGTAWHPTRCRCCCTSLAGR